MIDARLFDNVSDTLNKLAPPGMQAFKDDLLQNLRANIQTMLDKMELVTREEFDVQQALLARTREKLEQLEERVAVLEAQQNNETPPQK